MATDDKKKVAPIIDEAWAKSHPDWKALLDKSRGDVSHWDSLLEHMDSLRNDSAGPDATTTAAPQPFGGSLDPKASYYPDQNGKLVQGTAPQNYYQVSPGGRHGPTASLVVDMRAPLSAADIKSRNDNEQFFASKHGVVTENDAAFSQTFPGSATAARINSAATQQPFITPLTPPASLTPFSTTPADARGIAQQYGGEQPSYGSAPSRLGEINGNIAGTNLPTFGGEQIKISNPRPGSLEWPELPKAAQDYYR